MENITKEEIELMVSLVKSENPSISIEDINYKICEIWKIYIPLQKIKYVLDKEFEEDFELENRKIQYYERTINFVSNS